MSSQHSPTRHRAIEILCGLFVILILSFVYLVDSARDDARRSTCKGQLAQIGFALRSYYGEYGRMPPAYIADAQERPMHSWRVLMLPYIGGDEFYERYDFTEPWNGPNNSALAESAEAALARRVFFCPGVDSPPGACVTNYVALVGNDMLWQSDGGRVFPEEYARQHHDKWLVIECADSDIHWMEPRNLTRKDVRKMLFGDSTHVTSAHRKEIHVYTLGSRTIAVPLDVSSAEIISSFEFSR